MADEPKIRTYRCLRDFAFADKSEADEVELKKIERRLWIEQGLIRQALDTPHAILNSKLTPSHFEFKDYRIVWEALRGILPYVPVNTMIDDGVLVAKLAVDEPEYFAGTAGKDWLIYVRAQEAPGLAYALSEIVPRLYARHQMLRWKQRSQRFIEDLDEGQENPKTLHDAWRQDAYQMSLAHDGGAIGKSVSQMVAEWDPTNRENRNIVRLGIEQIDKPNGGGHGRGELMVIGGGTSHGKCLKINEKVLMWSGDVRLVQDVRVGDRIMGPDGCPRRVLRTNTGRGAMFEIRPTRGVSWYCNEDHILTLVGTGERAATAAKRRAGREGTRYGGQVIDVSVRDWMGWSKKRKHNFKLMHADEVEFGGRKRALSIDPYFLGVLLGDGSMQYGTVGLSTPDPEILAELHRQARKFKMSVTVHGYNPRCRTYHLCGDGAGRPNRVMTLLNEMGLRGTTCHDKFVPHQYKVASKADRLELLAGLIDTDGSAAGPDYSGYDFISKSKQLADDVAFVARSLGMGVAQVKRVRKGCQTGAVGTYYRLRIGGKKASTIPVRTPRRRLSKASYRRNMLLTGFQIVPTGKVDTYCGFTLDGDGRFLLGDFTVTHNSYAAQRIMRLQAQLKQRALYISVEDNAELFTARMFADYSIKIKGSDTGAIPPVDIRDKSADPDKVEQLKAEIAAEQGDSLYFFQAKKWTVSRICDVIRRYRYLSGVDLVIVDYLQAISPDEVTNLKANDTALIVAQLKACCTECEVALVLLSQYARDEYRNGLEPTIVSCKWAGEIENESEIMLLLWRDEADALHAKIAKLKWAKAAGRRYTINVSQATGVMGDWEDDFSQPASTTDRPQRRRGGRNNNGSNNGGGNEASI